jgi:acyl-CoA thioester hydrolase
MNGKPAESRERFIYWQSVPTRWLDNDQYGHVNNAHYYSFIDTIVNKMLVEKQVLKGPHWDAIGLVIASGCEFMAPISFPDVIDCGLRIGKIGNTSLRYEVGLFQQGERQPCAVGHFTHVFVDPTTRRPVPLAAAVRAAMTELVAPG